MELKNSIKKYRQIKGLTQEELGLKSGVSRQTIISIERYRYKPSLELGLKIALALETDINELFFLDVKNEETIKSTDIKETEKKPIKFQDFKEKDWKKLWVNLKKNN
ncbi:helix-turn-helix transcriptional regulator [Flavobacteriaceae bacterium]|nr:helix-turn-helix transcriptional regulator [Flavobacteriaceae bacterium]